MAKGKPKSASPGATAPSESVTLTRSDLRAGVRTPLEKLGIDGFVDADSFVAPEGMEILSNSPMIKPKDFPIGKVFSGVFRRLFHYTLKGGKNEPDKDGYGIELIPPGSNTGRSFPVVGTMLSALQITGEGDKATSPLLGRLLSLQKGDPERLPSKHPQPMWNFIVGVAPISGQKTLTGPGSPAS